MGVITEEIGDIFSAPPNSILIHACNAKGSWGSGVALAFKKKYPCAFRTYHSHCTSPPAHTSLSAHQASLAGTALLIPPSLPPSNPVTSKSTGDQQIQGKQYWIACLFTSVGYGRNVDKPEVILENTAQAAKDLARQIRKIKEEGQEVGAAWAVRINSGLFGVPWEETKRVLEEGELDILVVRPDSDRNANKGPEKQKGSQERDLKNGEGNGTKRKLSIAASNGSRNKQPGASDISNVTTDVKRRKKGALDAWLAG